MTPPTLESLLKGILTALAVTLALFLLGARFYQGYEDLRTQALREADLVREVVTRLPGPSASRWVHRLDPPWTVTRNPSGPSDRVLSSTDGATWGLTLNRRLLFAELVEANRTLLVWGMIGLLAAVEVSVFLAYGLTRPLRRLSWGCGELARGRPVRLPLGRWVSYELVQVTGMFNELAIQWERWRRVQAQMGRMDRLASLGELVSGVAHEIRNPLASMRIHLDLLASRLRDRPEVTEHLEALEAEVDRLGRTVDQFLAFARPRPPRREVLRPREILDWLARLLGNQGARNRVHVEAEAPPDLEPFEGDGDQIRQLLLNLGLNALRAMEGGGTLTLRAWGTPEGLRFAVEDTGPGIPEALRDRLFEPFVTTRSDGTGLGLAIAKRIALDHGGTLDFETSPRGTRFTLLLPREGLSEGEGPT